MKALYDMDLPTGSGNDECDGKRSALFKVLPHRNDRAEVSNRRPKANHKPVTKESQRALT